MSIMYDNGLGIVTGQGLDLPYTSETHEFRGQG
jgi:hypothetical protein